MEDDIFKCSLGDSILFCCMLGIFSSNRYFLSTNCDFSSLSKASYNKVFYFTEKQTLDCENSQPLWKLNFLKILFFFCCATWHVGIFSSLTEMEPKASAKPKC